MDQRQDINIGGVTAYAYARSKGYTGTEAEFAQLMANIGNTQQEIEAAIDEFINTTAPGAVQSVETAKTSALDAIGASKTDALDAINTSKGSAVAAVNRAGDTQKAAVDAEGQRVIDSIPADYTELTGEVDDLKSAFSNIAEVKQNFFNPADVVTGQFCAGDVGGPPRGAANASYAYIVVPVSFGETYIVSRSDYAWFEFDSDLIGLYRLGNQTGRRDFEYTPSDARVKYVAFSWLPSVAPIATYMVTLKGVSRANYVPYPSVTKFTDEVMAASGIENEKIYTVGSGKDFTSFTSCLRALQGDTSKKVIYVYSGEYDIFAELGGKAYMQSIDVSAGARAAQPWVPQNTRIVGVGDVLLKFNPSDEDIIDYNHGWLMSPLNISGSCEVENIAVEGSNCRYAMHIESAGANDDANTATIVLKNVRAKRTSTTLMGVHQVIGTGIGFDANWRLENCRIVGDAGSPGFSVHTNGPNSMESATVVLENCIFDTLDGQPTTNMLVQFISQYLPVAITNYAFVNNCFVRGKVGTYTTTSPHRQSFKVAVNGGVSNGLVNAPNMQSGYTVENYGNRTLS